jgi:CheY-like chemotaxis protein
MGISPEVLPRVFDLFAQGDRSMARAEGGLGIGLSVVKDLVEMHGGRVQAFSAGQGQGSELVVVLPVAFAAGMPDRSRPGPAQPSLSQPRVLVVDDNVDAADSLATLLRMSGYPVREAYSGESAVETAVGFQPDIVLLDIGLPEIDGYEVARRLRQIPELQGTRFVAVTGYGQEGDIQRSLERGFAQHLIKPLDPAKLLQILTTLAS